MTSFSIVLAEPVLVFFDDGAIELDLKAFKVNVESGLDSSIGGFRYGLNDVVAPKPMHDVLASIT